MANVLVVLCLWQIVLCIYPLSRLEPWPGRKNQNCRCLWNPSPATNYSCWQEQRFFQSNLIFPLKHKIHQCTYLECFYWHELLSGDKTAAAGRLKQQMRNTRAQRRRRRKWLRKRAVTSAVAGGWWLPTPVLPSSCPRIIQSRVQSPGPGCWAMGLGNARPTVVTRVMLPGPRLRSQHHVQGCLISEETINTRSLAENGINLVISFLQNVQFSAGFWQFSRFLLCSANFGWMFETRRFE